MSDEKLPVIILAGWSCAGKSTVAKKLADTILFDLIDVYEVYHDIAVSKGYKRSRYWLHKVGGRIFANETTFRIVDYIKLFNESCGVVIDASFGARMNSVLRKELSEIHIINCLTTIGC